MGDVDKPASWSDEEWTEWNRRRMTDEELLDRAIDALREHDHALAIFHRRHGAGPFEDICCRAVTGDVNYVLAEAERREYHQEGTDE